MINWNEVLQEVIIAGITFVIGSVSGWFFGLFKGKKESSRAIERKNEIYQPLIDEVEKHTNNHWLINEKIKKPLLIDIINNPYKYGLSDDIQKMCNNLYSIIDEYNDIDPIRIAHNLIVDIFEKGYAKIYGNIIVGTTYNSDCYGNEWEEDVLAEPVNVIRQSNFLQDIEKLLLNEGYEDDQVCIDQENNLYLPVYSRLKQIYHQCLNVVIEGEEYKNPSPIIELNMLPEEYMVINFDFFDIYNNNEMIKRKYALREEIIYSSQSLAQSLKEIIDRIIKKYELEEI